MITRFFPKHFLKNIDKILANKYIFDKGFVMFADISGFTAMSEQLSQKGMEGSEEISHILNEIFEDIIDIIRTFKGSVYSFGGDALTVFFPEEEVTYELVLIVALKIMDKIEKRHVIKTIAGNVSTGIKIGISYGEIISGFVGDMNFKKYFLAGSTLDNACLCEHNANKSEIVVDENFIQCANHKFFEKFNSIYYRFNMSKEQIEHIFAVYNIPKNSFITFDDDIKDLSAFVSDNILSKYDVGEIGKGELRNCTVLFLSFSDINYDLEQFDYNLLNKIFSLVQLASLKYDGFINKIDMGDKGNKILIFFGAPIAMENSEELALKCAEEIKNEISKIAKINIKIGINSGNVYFGIIGSENRLEFTVIGSDINLSARLMATCKNNEILISSKIKNKVSHIKYSEEKKIKLKGISEPIMVYSFEKIAEKRINPRISIIGLLKEQSIYQEIITTNLYEKKLILLRSEAGLGKSVLTNIFFETSKTIKTNYLVNCQTYTKNTPFYPIKLLVNKFIGIDETNDNSVLKIDKLKQLLLKINEERNLSLFSIFMDFKKTSQHIDISLKEMFSAILLKIFSYIMLDKKSFIFIEDFHLADDKSILFFRKLIQILLLDKNSDFLIHFVYRPNKDMDYYESLTQSKIIELKNLDKNEAKKYILRKFYLKSIPAKLYNNIYLKTKGNPFFMDEIMLSIKHSNHFKPVETINNQQFYKIRSSFQNITISDNLTDAVLSRIDKLDENSKSILKIASVIGRSFKLEMLKELQVFINEKETPQELKDNLEYLTKLNLTIFEQTKENEYLFKNIIIQEVAYKTLLYSLRRFFHNNIANLYEIKYRKNLSSIYELLAFHYKEGKNSSKAKEYLLKSALKIKNKFAYPEAISFLKDYKKYKLTPAEKNDAFLTEIDILKITEKRKKALLLCEKMMEFNTPNDFYYQKAICEKASILRKEGDFEQVIVVIDSIKKYATEDIKLLALLHKVISYMMMGNIKEMTVTATYITENISKTNDPQLIIWLKEFLGRKLMFERNFEEAIQIFKWIEKKSGKHKFYSSKIAAYQNIGACYGQSGKFKESEVYFKKAFTEASKIYNFDLIIGSISNLSKVFYVTGNYKKAEKFIGKGLKLAERFNKLEHRETLLSALSSVKLETGDYKKVLDLCDERTKIVIQLHAKHKLPVINDIRGDAYFQSGNKSKEKNSKQAEKDFKKALGIYQENLISSKKYRNIEITNHTYGNLANCYAELGFIKKALSFYKKQIAYAKKYNDKQSQGKVLYNLAYTYFENLKDFVNAKKYCDEAIDICTEISYKYGCDLAEELKDDIKKAIKNDQ